jgi:DNA-binding IscR family transcriptional regulator
VVQCLEGEAIARGSGQRDTPESDVLAALERRLDAARRSILEGTTLLDLLEERDRLVQAQAMYFI